MLISVCIPHYNRSKHLLAVLESIRVQDHPEVEVLISDDCSTDDSAEVIPRYIKSVASSSHVRFVYIRQPGNLGYDGNLRAALSAATGEYLFILGNDDGLSSESALSQLSSILTQLNYPGVALTNYHPFGSRSRSSRRARSTALIGSGPELAVRTFRNFSFVAGIVMKASSFKAHNTVSFDNSVYIQIYLAARSIASGETFATIADAMVEKDLEVDGQKVNSYTDHLLSNNRTIHRETGGLDQVGFVAAEAILPFVASKDRQRYLFRIYAQLLAFTYPYWLLSYRKQKVYRAAVNLALGCFPTYLTKRSSVSLRVCICLLPVFVTSTAAGLLLPISLLEAMTLRLVRLSKKIGPSHSQPALVELSTTRAHQ